MNAEGGLEGVRHPIPLESWNLFHDRDQEPKAPASLRRRILHVGGGDRHQFGLEPIAHLGDRTTLERDTDCPAVRP
jgi:hypothetical protein